ncbi:MAG: hypothetical protein Q9157_005412 [Trypethelium eluteriae]
MPNNRAAHSSTNGTTRPATVIGDHETSVSDQPVLGKRKGRIPSYISSATPDTPGSLQSFAQRQRHRSQAVVISSGPIRKPSIQQTSAPAQQQHVHPSNHSRREFSFTSAFNNMNLDSDDTQKYDSMFDIESTRQSSKATSTPSHIPRLATATPNLLEPPTLFQPTSFQSLQSPSPLSKHSRSQQSRSPSPTRQFLNRFSNTVAPAPAWDTKGRLEDMESLYAQLKGQMDSTTFERNGLEETVNLYKTRLNELEEIRKQLSSSNHSLKRDLDDTKVKLSTTNTALDDSRRAHTHEVDDLTRKHRNEIEDSSDRHRKDRERLRKEAQEELDGLGKEHREEIDKLIRQHKDDLNELENRLKAEIEEQRSQRLKVVQDLSTQIALQQQSTDINISNKNREAQTIREDLSRTASELEQERALNDSLKKKLAEAGMSTNLTVEAKWITSDLG